MSRSSGESLYDPAELTYRPQMAETLRGRTHCIPAGEISLCVCAAIAVNSSAFRFTHSWLHSLPTRAEVSRADRPENV